MDFGEALQVMDLRSAPNEKRNYFKTRGYTKSNSTGFVGYIFGHILEVAGPIDKKESGRRRIAGIACHDGHRGAGTFVNDTDAAVADFAGCPRPTMTCVC